MGVHYTSEIALDATGEATFLGDCSHVYGYDSNGNIITDTATNPHTGTVHVKTYAFAANVLQSESVWVRQ